MLVRPGSAAYNPPGAPGSGPSAAIEPTITSLVDLASISTVNLVTPAIRIWINAADGTEQIWKLLVSNEATSEGIQRPVDYNPVTNPKVWFRAGT